MIYLNGQIISENAAKIESSDKRFLLSDGLFETLRVYSGKVFCLREHLERLHVSARILEIPVKMTIDAVYVNGCDFKVKEVSLSKNY